MSRNFVGKLLIFLLFFIGSLDTKVLSNTLSLGGKHITSIANSGNFFTYFLKPIKKFPLLNVINFKCKNNKFYNSFKDIVILDCFSIMY